MSSQYQYDQPKPSNDSTFRLQWETTCDQIYLFITLVVLLLLYLYPWTRTASLEQLTTNVTVNLISLIFGGILIAVLQFLPAILGFIAILFIIKRKNAGLISAAAALSVLLYWGGYFIVMVFIKNLLGGSFKFHFYLIPAVALVVILIAVFSPGRNKRWKLELVEKRYNAVIKGVNILLLVLLLIFPWVQFNSGIENAADYGRMLEQATVKFLNTEIGLRQIVKYIKAGMLVINLLIKLIPFLGILFYLFYHRRSGKLITLNFITVFYIFAAFIILWNIVKPIEIMIEMTEFLYLSLIIAVFLLGASIVAKFSLPYGGNQ